MIFIGLMIAVLSFGQLANTFKYEIRSLGGLVIGPTATANKATVTSWILDGNFIKGYDGATQRSFAIAAADQIDGATLYVKRLLDTAAYASTTTLSVADVNVAWIEATNATYMSIIIPADATYAFPIGTIINIRNAGAGPVGIRGAANVGVYAPKDSLTINTPYGVATIRKRGVNHWEVFGYLED